MIELKNLQKHMAGQAVRVNGTTYPINSDGTAKVKPEDAEKMLAGKDWCVSKPGDARKMKKEAIPEAANKQAREMLERAEDEIDRLHHELGKAHEEIERLKTELESRPPAEGDLLGDDGQPATEGEEEPDESMDIEKLKAMADKHGVAYGANIGPALLVERIKEAVAKSA